MSEIVFLSGKRTPFGTLQGVLSGFTANDLGVLASNAAIEQAGIAPSDVDHVIFGNVLQTSGDAIYCARHIGLRSGGRIDTPALTVNRLCGSGLEALIYAARSIRLARVARGGALL